VYDPLLFQRFPCIPAAWIVPLARVPGPPSDRFFFPPQDLSSPRPFEDGSPPSSPHTFLLHSSKVLSSFFFVVVNNLPFLLATPAMFLALRCPAFSLPHSTLFPTHLWKARMRSVPSLPTFYVIFTVSNRAVVPKQRPERRYPSAEPLRKSSFSLATFDTPFLPAGDLLSFFFLAEGLGEVC